MRNDIRLSAAEARVIGSLIEKEVTTPDQYPLSLNALRLACNQKSSREPVMSLSDDQLQDVIESLRKKHLVMERSGFGSRVPKFKQRFCNTEFSSLQFTSEERGIVCALMLRGPQTPGELRSHTNRLCEFADVGQVDETLEHLMERPDGPFVAKLPREPGKRECRFMHLFCGPGEPEPKIDDRPPVADEAPDTDPLRALERRVESLERQVAEMQTRLSGRAQE